MWYANNPHHLATPYLPLSKEKFWNKRIYRVKHQCCPGGNRSETPGDPPQGVSGGSPEILAKSMANPDKIFKKFLLTLLNLSATGP